MQIVKMIDLSIPLNDETTVFPGDPKPHFCQATTIEADGFRVTAMHLGSHSGTHIDAPSHFIEDGPSIDELPLNSFVGTGIIFDVRGKEKGQAITLKDIGHIIETCHPNNIALFLTGWTKYIGTPTYFEHPYVSIEVVNALLQKGVKTFFIDTLNIDPPDGSTFEAHVAILEQRGVIGENFTNIECIDFQEPFICALPLKVSGVDGSPIRAVAIQFAK